MNSAELKLLVPQMIMKHGGRVYPALAEAGVKYDTHRNWMYKDKVYNSRVAAAKAQLQRKGAPTAAMSFEQHRLTYFKRHTQPQQVELVRELEAVKEREIVLVLIYPEAGKTATIEDWLCKKIGENPDIRVTYLGESTDLAKKVLSYIKGRMTEPDWLEYQRDYGPFYIQGQEAEGKPWTQSYITVNKASHAERDYTIQCRAVTSRAYGSRIDLLIGDDIQSRETYSQTDKILSHLRQTYFTRGKRMTMVFVGTRIGPGDVYERLIEEGLIDRLIELQAAVGDEPKYPESWADRDDYETDEEWLEAARLNMARIRHHVGPEVWETSYQQRPRSNQLASFTDDLIAQAKSERVITPPTRGTFVTLSLDPALGGMNALLASEYRLDSLQLIDLQTDEALSQTEQIIERIQQLATMYRPTQLVIEKNAFQRGLANDYRLAEVAARHGFLIRHHETGRNKTDPTLGVAAMAGGFIAHEIDIPWGDDTTRSRFKPLIDQLSNWRPNIPTRMLKQDAVMALWFAWKNWQEWRESAMYQTASTPARRPSWLREFVGTAKRY